MKSRRRKKKSFYDKTTVPTSIYVEPVLQGACDFMAQKMQIGTMSKFIRYCIIRVLLNEKYPIDKVSQKIYANYKSMRNKANDKRFTGIR